MVKLVPALLRQPGLEIGRVKLQLLQTNAFGTAGLQSNNL